MYLMEVLCWTVYHGNKERQLVCARYVTYVTTKYACGSYNSLMGMTVVLMLKMQHIRGVVMDQDQLLH